MTSTQKPKYEKKELSNHIYDTPDTYCGGAELVRETKYIFNSVTKSVDKKEYGYVPAIMSLFNEILVNARDQKIRIDILNKNEKK